MSNKTSFITEFLLKEAMQDRTEEICLEETRLVAHKKDLNLCLDKTLTLDIRKVSDFTVLKEKFQYQNF